MGVPGVWAGLTRSAFLAGVDRHDREPVRILVVVVGGAGVGFIAAIAGWVLASVPVAILLGWGDEGLQALPRLAMAVRDPTVNGLDIMIFRLLLATLTDGAFLLGFVALAARVGERPLSEMVTAAPRFRWRLMVLAMGLSAAAMAPVIVIERLFDSPPGPIPIVSAATTAAGRVAYVLAAGLLVPAAAAEELFFRGWLLRLTAAFSVRPAVLIAVPASVFALAHLDFTPSSLLLLATLGAGFAYMTLRLGGIEFSTGVHAAYNMLLVLFLAPFSVSIGTGGGLSPGGVAEVAALAGGHLLITEAVARLPSLRRLAGLRLEEVAGAPLVGGRP